MVPSELVGIEFGGYVVVNVKKVWRVFDVFTVGEPDRFGFCQLNNVNCFPLRVKMHENNEFLFKSRHEAEIKAVELNIQEAMIGLNANGTALSNYQQEFKRLVAHG